MRWVAPSPYSSLFTSPINESRLAPGSARHGTARHGSQASRSIVGPGWATTSMPEMVWGLGQSNIGVRGIARKIFSFYFHGVGQSREIVPTLASESVAIILFQFFYDNAIRCWYACSYDVAAPAFQECSSKTKKVSELWYLMHCVYKLSCCDTGLSFPLRRVVGVGSCSRQMLDLSC